MGTETKNCAYVTASEKWARTGRGNMLTIVTVARNL
jgi:hypothetical protein